MIGLTHYNTDRTDDRINTNAPFEYECPCKFGRITLPQSAFISIKLYIDEGMTLPARLSRVYSPDPSSVAVEFCDSHNVLIGTWTAPLKLDPGCEYVSGFIYDDDGILRGHVVSDPSTPGTLNAACRFIGGDIKTSLTDFILLRQCCVPWYIGKVKRISINGNTTSSDVVIGIKRPTAVDPGELDDIFIWSVPAISTDITLLRIDAFGDFDKTFIGLLTGYQDDQFRVGKPGLLQFSLIEGGGAIHIDDIGNASLMVRSTKLSNLRVVTVANSISCVGVSSTVDGESVTLSSMQDTISAAGAGAVQPILQYTQPVSESTASVSATDTNTSAQSQVNIVTPSQPAYRYLQFTTAMEALHE